MKTASNLTRIIKLANVSVNCTIFIKFTNACTRAVSTLDSTKIAWHTT